MVENSENPYEITHPLIMLCEGDSDYSFFEKLCQERGIFEFDTPFQKRLKDDDGNEIKGDSRFGDMLKFLAPTIKSSFSVSVTGIIIAVDCGDAWQKSFRNVARQIEKAEIEGQRLYPRPEAPLAPVAATVSGLPPLVIVMVPGEDKKSGLESLCVDVLREKHPNPAACLEDYLACLDGKGVGIKKWTAEKQGKAWVQCLIAATSRDEPNRAFTKLFKRNKKKPPLIDVSHPAFDTLAADLKTAVAALSGD
jgi:hypothetical protein